jgi:preprotein translocase subunit SecD
VKLHDELDRLANAAGPVPSVERVLTLARRRRARYLVGVPVVAVAMATVVALTYAWVGAPRGQAASSTYTIAVTTAGTPDPATLTQTRQLLLQRAQLIGLVNARIDVLDQRDLVLTVDRRPDDATLRNLTAPGRLTVRRVVDTTGTPDNPGSPYGGDVTTLSAADQFRTASVTCGLLDQRRGTDGSAPGALTACGSLDGQSVKYLLDVAAVGNQDVEGLTLTNDPGAGWAVTVRFTVAGQTHWTDLTRQVYGDGTGDPASRQVAFVVDDRVVSASAIESVITGDAIVYGQFSQAQATGILAELRYGPLPLALSVER